MLAASSHLQSSLATPQQAAPVCIVIESEGCIGGNAALWHLCAQLAADAPSAQFLLCAELRHSPERSLLPQSVQDRLHHTRYEFIGADEGVRKQVLTEARRHGEQASSPLVVLVDSISLLHLYEGGATVLQALRDIAQSPDVSAVVGVVYAQQHDAQEVAALQHLATCQVILKPVSALQAEVMASATGQRVHIEAVTSTLRHSGRLKVDSGLFEMHASGALLQHTAPPNLNVTAQQLAAKNVAELQQQAAQREQEERSQLQSKYEKDMSGFMKLTLSAQEREQREKVVLPWQHQGESGNYQSSDFKEYLPPAAGGHGKGGGKDGLGHIMYVRDSDDSHDSDEDPDDDLDI